MRKSRLGDSWKTRMCHVAVDFQEIARSQAQATHFPTMPQRGTGNLNDITSAKIRAALVGRKGPSSPRKALSRAAADQEKEKKDRDRHP